MTPRGAREFVEVNAIGGNSHTKVEFEALLLGSLQLAVANPDLRNFTHVVTNDAFFRQPSVVGGVNDVIVSRSRVPEWDVVVKGGGGVTDGLEPGHGG